MKIVLDVLLIILMIFGIISLIFSLPGNVIILVSVILYGLLTGFEELGLRHFIILFILLVAGESLEYISGIIGAGRYGASKSGIIGAIIGGIVGGIIGAGFLFGIGAIPGVIIGTFLGAVIVEIGRGRKLESAFKSGIGAFLGRVFGIFMKIVIGLTMIFFTLRTIFF